MSKEISIGVDAAHLEAFAKAVENNPKIDFRNFNPHLAVRCRIADELSFGHLVRLSAVVNGGTNFDVLVNGNKVECGALGRRGLESIINVYTHGRGEKIAAAMLRGKVLVLNRS